MTGWAIFGVRLVLVPLALWALWLNWRAVLDLGRGGWTMSQVARGQICFFGSAAVLGQFFYLVESYPPALLLALLLMTAGMVLSINLSIRGQEKGLRLGLELMLDRPDLALPLVELVAIDPDHAERLAQEARHAVAIAKAEL